VIARLARNCIERLLKISIYYIEFFKKIKTSDSSKIYNARRKIFNFSTNLSIHPSTLRLRRPLEANGEEDMIFINSYYVSKNVRKKLAILCQGGQIKLRRTAKRGKIAPPL